MKQCLKDLRTIPGSGIGYCAFPSLEDTLSIFLLALLTLKGNDFWFRWRLRT